MNLIEQSAEHLFGFFQKTLPKPQRGKAKPEAVQAAMEKFYEEVRQERQRRKFGFLARARLAFILQRKLLEAGYAPELVRQVLFSVLVIALVGKNTKS